jgi:hypothetical protein
MCDIYDLAMANIVGLTLDVCYSYNVPTAHLALIILADQKGYPEGLSLFNFFSIFKASSFNLFLASTSSQVYSLRQYTGLPFLNILMNLCLLRALPILLIAPSEMVKS